MVQTNFRNLSDVPALPGMPHGDRAVMGKDIITRTLSGKTKQTVGTITVAGTIGTETFTITVNGVSPTSGTFSKTVTYTATSGNTATIVAAALVALLNADADINDILVASNSAGVITLTVRYFDVNPVTSVSATASGSATITTTPTVTAASSSATVPYGYMVGWYTGDDENTCKRITTASSLVQIGVALRPPYATGGYPFNASTAGSYSPGETVYVMRTGYVWVPAAAAIVVGTAPAIVTASGQFTTNGAGSSTATSGVVAMRYNSANSLALINIAVP